MSFPRCNFSLSLSCCAGEKNKYSLGQEMVQKKCFFPCFTRSVCDTGNVENVGVWQGACVEDRLGGWVGGWMDVCVFLRR